MLASEFRNPSLIYNGYQTTAFAFGADHDGCPGSDIRRRFGGMLHQFYYRDIAYSRKKMFISAVHSSPEVPAES